jgi:hypothetical protein
MKLDSPGEVAKSGTLLATRPLSYLEVNPNQGPFFMIWYWKCVVC